jgi:hypothetical protein
MDRIHVISDSNTFEGISQNNQRRPSTGVGTHKAFFYETCNVHDERIGRISELSTYTVQLKLGMSNSLKLAVETFIFHKIDKGVLRVKGHQEIFNIYFLLIYQA